MRANEFITELKSSAEVQELESQLDHMFSTVGLDVEFSQHFVERLLGREKRVTAAEIQDAFAKLKKKYKQKLLKAKKHDNERGVLQDFDSDLNVIFAIKADREGGHELVNITVKKKDPDEFYTDTPTGSATPYKVGSKKTNEGDVVPFDRPRKPQAGDIIIVKALKYVVTSDNEYGLSGVLANQIGQRSTPTALPDGPYEYLGTDSGNNNVFKYQS